MLQKIGNTLMLAAGGMVSISLLGLGLGTVGLLFGLYPAARASKLDPIEALRYE